MQRILRIIVVVGITLFEALLFAQEVEVGTIQLDQSRSLDGLAIGNNGILYGSAGFDGSNIYIIGRDGATSVFASGLNGPIDMDFDHAGNMYVSTFNDQGLFKITQQGEKSPYATVSIGPSGVSVRRDFQQVFVSHYGTGFPGNGNAIYIADTTGFATSFVFGQGLNVPVSLAIDEAGNLYAPNIADARLFKITPDKTVSLLAQLPTSTRHPFNIGHIAYARGKLYLTGNSSQPFVYEVELDGTHRILAGSGAIGGHDGPGLQASFNAPNGITPSFDGDTLFISELNRPAALRIVVFPEDTTNLKPRQNPLQGFRLHQNYPNPFNPTTTIEFELPVASAATLEIYNINGRHVETHNHASLRVGMHKSEWNGTDAAGNLVSSGVYIYRLRAGDFVKTRKMLLVR